MPFKTLLGALAFGLAAGAVQAADYPDRPIRLVVPVTPGGPNDIFARTLQPRLGALLGQQVLVENVPGAGGNIAVNQVARQPHDGYNLILHGMTYAVNPSIFGPERSYRVGEFVPVSWDDALSDIAFNAPLSFNATIKAGPVYMSDMFKLYKYENQLYVMRMTGDEIRRHLEMSYDQWVNTMEKPEDHLLLFDDTSDDAQRLGFKNFLFKAPHPIHDRIKAFQLLLVITFYIHILPPFQCKTVLLFDMYL